ncbi:MAG: cation:proton antiporter [Chitinispirillaceae bacterium]
MLLILVAPLIARRLRLPGIVGLLLAGIIVGPYGFAILARDNTIELLGTVGLLFIMFLAGLEIDLNQVKRNRSHTLVFGLATFLTPMLMGTFMGVGIFEMTIPVAILLASMFSSHTLVTYSIVNKLGLSKSPPVTTTVGGTIITDTLALLILAVIASASQGEIGTSFWIRLFTFMIIYVAGVMIIVPLLAGWFFRSLNVDENVEFVFVIAITFLVAYLAHVAGLEPIIGAFLAGLTLNSFIPERSLLMTRIHFVGDALFIPFFLLSVGMLVNLNLLISGTEAWIISIGMTVIALVAKYSAAELTGRILRYNRNEIHLIFGLSVNQAAATLAAVLIGFELGLFSENVITGTILMIAVTCLIGSIITDKAGRQVALKEEQEKVSSATYQNRIMIPLESREGAKELLDISLLLREKGSHEPLYPVHVVQEGGDSEVQVASAEKILAHTVVRTMAAGVPVMPITSVDINVLSGILRSMKDYRISTVVMGWDGKTGLKTRVFGHSIDAIVERSRQLIMIHKIVRPINSVSRLVVILPPFAQREIGFGQFASAIRTLANQTATSILFICDCGTQASVSEVMNSARSSVKMNFIPYKSWKKVLDDVHTQLKPDDWLVLMSVRKGEIAWQPTLDRLPRQISASFPHNSFSTVISPTEKWVTVKSPETTSRIFTVFREEHLLLSIDTADCRTVIYKLLRSHYEESEEMRRLEEELYSMSQKEPVELIQDVVLLHTYGKNIDETITFLGVSTRPLDIPLASGSPRVVIILLDPEGQEPAKHLEGLANIANLIRVPGIVGVLEEADDFDSLVVQVAERLGGEGE